MHLDCLLSWRLLAAVPTRGEEERCPSGEKAIEEGRTGERGRRREEEIMSRGRGEKGEEGERGQGDRERGEGEGEGKGEMRERERGREE